MKDDPPKFHLISSGEKKGGMRVRLRTFPLRRLIPLSVTLLSLCLGITSIRLAIEGRFELAVGAIILACMLDFFDGLLARLLKSSSHFGAELDSLADCLNFGVAPPFILYLWSMDALGNLGWIVALFYAICCALRLARFNTALHEESEDDQEKWEKSYFVGVPAPSAAGLALTPLYMHFLGILSTFWGAYLSLIFCIGVGLLMISRIPTFSLKPATMQIESDMVVPLIVGIALIGVIIIAFPWASFTLLSGLYLSVMPVSFMTYQRSLAKSRKKEPAPELKKEV